MYKESIIRAKTTDDLIFFFCMASRPILGLWEALFSEIKQPGREVDNT
jgi:hypothetical protein